MLKKFILALAIASTLITVTPKAHAGLGIGFIVGAPGAGAAIGFGTGAAVSGLMAWSEGCFDSGECFASIIAAPILIGVGTLLDLETALTHDEFVSAFHEKYPFVDNHEALSKLAELAKNKLASQLQVNPEAKNALIAFSKEEVAAALETADITEAQFEQIVSDLK